MITEMIHKIKATLFVFIVSLLKLSVPATKQSPELAQYVHNTELEFHKQNKL